MIRCLLTSHVPMEFTYHLFAHQFRLGSIRLLRRCLVSCNLCVSGVVALAGNSQGGLCSRIPAWESRLPLGDTIMQRETYRLMIVYYVDASAHSQADVIVEEWAKHMYVVDEVADAVLRDSRLHAAPLLQGS